MKVDLVVVGSVGLDTVETPRERREEVLGGSASYACLAASFFCRPGMVAVIGEDFPPAFQAEFSEHEIDLEGLRTAPGLTFRWTGAYAENMDDRETRRTELNVFESFLPQLSEGYGRTPFLFLANISPALQLHVLDQLKETRLVLADTMDLWINTCRDELMEVIRRVDLLTLNESESRLLTGEPNLFRAARTLLALGPRHVLIKKGAYGSLLFSRNQIFILPAFPLEDVVDPTGAGDMFAGAFMGALAASGAETDGDLRKAMVYGSVVAAFGVEAFSADRLMRLTREQIEERAGRLMAMVRVE